MPENPAEDAQITVLSKLVRQYSSWGTVFLCIESADPPNMLVDRVSFITGTCVRLCHTSVWDSNGVGRLVDPDTGGHAVAVGVSHVKQVSDEEFEMEGGYSCGGLCAASFHYRVRREGTGWKILSEEMLWIS